MKKGTFQKITRTDLQRDSGEIFDALMRGRAYKVAKHGKPRAVLLDIYDYYCLSAVATYSIQEVPPQEELQKAISETKDEEIKHTLLIWQYLNKDLSLERTAKLLGITSGELTARFFRLEIPIREGE